MHPHIIRLYDVVETTNDIYVVMEYVKVSGLIRWRRHSKCKAEAHLQDVDCLHHFSAVA